ncbi:polynucleotide adenylyltransferase PcnB [Vibrio superstes]|uniref:Poly(A) polymerase I n=1 Tax=Vibrio superstes NBRC 103154 TaxID=1219062 RepID=A0A511QUP7_9VIBR|nr:polynucleotide adenylyltransferase PcnB [Vibrio superstes]GEM81088.1 poly(A) polymerase I [Vibrio superstes NBRC 103154]
MTSDFDSNNSVGKIDLTIYPRDKHNISREHISENALKVLYRLQKAGYDAFLVGGGVRDLLLDKSPKDFDIATNATPEQIKQLFRNCRLIGRRFRLAHIIFGRDIIEVATFRGHHQEPEKQTAVQSDEGMLLRDNVYGSIDEDAERRDFTINAMYYNIADYSIHDYANGMQDLNEGMVRLIGDAEVRYREDPVRMLRAIRFASKLDMDISFETADPINYLAPLLQGIPAARLYEESLKLLQSGHGLDTYDLLREFGLFEHLFPQVAELFTEEENSKAELMIELVLESTDQRIAEGKRVNPAFMFAAMLWYPLEAYAARLMAEQGMSEYDAMMVAGNHILDEQVRSTAIPRRHTATIREVWQLQSRLERRSGKRAFRLLELNKFRAGFDFLEMRGEVEQGDTQKLAQWWHTFQHSGRNMRQAMVNDLASGGKSGSARRRRPAKKKPKKTNS